jgi:hypothetical protein
MRTHEGGPCSLEDARGVGRQRFRDPGHPNITRAPGSQIIGLTIHGAGCDTERIGFSPRTHLIAARASAWVGLELPALDITPIDPQRDGSLTQTNNRL